MQPLAHLKTLPRLLTICGALLTVCLAGLPLPLRAATPGSVDPTFAVGQQLDGQVYQVAQQPEGHVAVLYFTFNSPANPNTANSNAISQLDANGARVATFGSGGYASPLTGSPTVMAVQPTDGKIVYGGRRPDTALLTPVGRLNADGTPDTSFQFGAFQSASGAGDVYALALQADGKILVGGFFSEYNGISRSGLARLNADGSLDDTFTPPTASGSVLDDVLAVATQVDGKVLVAGNFRVSGNTQGGLVRLNADGSLDSSFAFVRLGANALSSRVPVSLAVQPDGNILVAGFFQSINGSQTYYMSRVLANGTVDSSFAPIFEAAPSSIAVQADGKIVVGGGFTSVAVGDTKSNGVARLNADGSKDTAFDIGSGPYTGSPTPTINSVALQKDGKVLVGGAFASFNGAAMQNVVRLLVADAPTPPDGALTVPGTSNLWLAGATPGATASEGQDNLSNATPFQVPNLTLTAGQVLSFSATGNVSNDPANPVTVGPDGGPYLGFTLYGHEKENGIANLTAPINSLIGVFLDDSVPNPLTVPDGYDLSQPPGTDYTLIGPALRKPFFIGDGKTTDGMVQKIRVPTGATRLFLGSLDPSDQENNPGSFFVTINGGTTTPPTNTGPALTVNADDFSYAVKNQPSTGTVVPNDVVTYSLTVRNTGTAPATNVVVRASFDANNAKFKSASFGGTATVNVVTWTLPSIANGDHTTLTYSIKVKGNVDTRSGIRLGASVLSATADAPATPLSTANLPGVGLTAVPLFNVSTQSDGVTAVGGGTLTFTFTVVNRGTTYVNDVSVLVHLPDNYLPANFKSAYLVDDNGNPISTPFKLGANLGNGQTDPAAVLLIIDNLNAGASARFAVTVNVPYDAAPGSTVTLPSVKLTGYDSGGNPITAYNSPDYTAKISNNASLAPPKVILTKLSPTASEIDALRLAALADPKKLAGKSAKQLLQAIADATGQTVDQLNAFSSEQIVALINPFVTVDTDTDDNGNALLDVPAPNPKQPAPYITYVLFYLNTSDTGTAAGITISDSLAPGLKLDPNSVYIKGKKVLSTTVADGSGNLTFTDKNIKPGSGGLITYHALVPAAGTSTLNPGDVIQPVTASLTTASLSSQSFGTTFDNGILVTGPANAVCESSQVNTNQVTADGNIVYDIYYKNTGGKKSKDFLVVSPVPQGAVYRSTYVPAGSTQPVASASFLEVSQQVRAANQTKGEGIVEPAGANTAAGATSGLVAFHLGKVKPGGLGLVRVVYRFSPTLFAKQDVSINHQPYVDSGSFPTTNGVLTRPTPRGLREGPHTLDFSGSVTGVFKPAVANTTHLFTPLQALSTPVTQSAPQAPHLSLLQIAPLSVVPGGNLQYTFAVTNTSDVAAGSTTLFFDFPDNTTYVSDSSGGRPDVIGKGFISGPALYDLAAHQTKTITLMLKVNAAAGSVLLGRNTQVNALSTDLQGFSGSVYIGKMATTVITAAQAADTRQLGLVQSTIATNAVQAQGFSASTLVSAPNFAARAAKITPDSIQTAVAGADVVSLDQGASLVAAGAGNLVAAGAGNLVAAGAGNLVAAGAGNLVAAGAGNLITLNGISGLGTLNGSDLLLPANLSKLVAAGAGNLVAAGAGNLISQDGSGLLSNVTGLASGTLASLQDRAIVAGIGNIATQGLIGNAGGTLVGNAGGTLISQDGAGLIGNAGGALVAAGAGNLVAAGAGNLTGHGHPAPGQPYTRDITTNGGIKLGSPDNSKYVHFNNAGGFVFSVNPDLKNQ